MPSFHFSRFSPKSFAVRHYTFFGALRKAVEYIVPTSDRWLASILWNLIYMPGGDLVGERAMTLRLSRLWSRSFPGNRMVIEAENHVRADRDNVLFNSEIECGPGVTTMEPRLRSNHQDIAELPRQAHGMG